ncbi:MAG: glycosyltransferase family 2 protein [Candidatus Acidiferrales bacterium]
MLSLPGLSISVIIPTKNRAADLEKAVESLLAQTRLPDELVLVDQSPERSFTRPTNRVPVRYIHDPTLSGASTARNAGMDAASGDIWLFLDDDVILEPEFIEKILAAYGPGVTGVSGVVTNYDRPALGHLLWETVFVRGPFLDDRQRVYRRADRLKDDQPIKVRQFGAGLMSFRSSAVKELRFDPNLTGASPGEDIDFCARLPKGSILLIAPQARLVHRRSPAGRNQAHWLLLHAQVSTYMHRRHWRSGVWNNLCFAWMNVGYALAASLSSLKRGSLEPWRAWRQGLRTGTQIARGYTHSDVAPKRQ